MNKVSVSEECLSAMMTAVQNARSGLEGAVVDLRKAYSRAGEEWRDKKYRQLGVVIERAVKSILLIGYHLSGAKEKLNKLQQAVEEYINTGQAALGSNPGAYDRPVQHTSQEFVRTTVRGRDAVVFDHPQQLATRLHTSQGNNTFDMDGTCSLASTANMLTISGRPTEEQEIVEHARNNGLCSITGGTDINFVRLQRIWRDFGEPGLVLMGDSPEQLARAIEDGHGVVLSVNDSILYGEPCTDIDVSPNHAVTATSVARDPNTNEILGFFICNTGRGIGSDGGMFVSTERMNAAHFNVSNHGMIYTNNVIW